MRVFKYFYTNTLQHCFRVTKNCITYNVYIRTLSPHKCMFFFLYNRCYLLFETGDGCSRIFFFLFIHTDVFFLKRLNGPIVYHHQKKQFILFRNADILYYYTILCMYNTYTNSIGILDDCGYINLIHYK